jgi:peptide/nickel transport system substrate-binding protein
MRTAQGRVRAVAAVIILVALGSGLAGAQGQPKPGGTLVAAQYEPQWWNPLLEAGAPFVNRLIYIGLTDYDKDGNVVPGLAQSWTISRDGLTYTFPLRRDVKWQDGKPFTAADVKFTYEKILDPKTSSWLRAFFDAVTQVDTPDDYTVVLRLRAPSATLLYNMWHGILPRHVWEKEDLAKSTYNAAPVGTGPFKVGQWARGDFVTLVPSDTYFRGRPYLDKLILKTIPDTAVTFAALERGEVHYLPAFGIIGGVPYHQVKSLEAKPQLHVSVTETTQAQHLYMRVDKPPFDNLKVRQAIVHAINKKEIADRMTAGYGRPLDSRVPPVIGWAHNASVKTYPYDVAEANRLLDEAGLRRGPDGVRFKTRLYATPGSRVIMSELLREQLRAVGISAEITTSEWNTYIGAIRDKRTVDGLWSIFHPTYIPDPEILLINFWSKEIKPGGRNYMFYSNPRMDRLIEQAATTGERSERGKLVREIQEIVAAEIGNIPLFVQPSVEVWNRKFRGFQPLEYGGGTFTFMEKVWQEKE